jgi:hypothetical protein
MFTTATFEAQLVSMPRRAETPPKELGHQPTHDRGQCPFHPRDDDQDLRRAQQLGRGEQTMQPRHADILQQLDLVPEATRHLLGLRRHRQIGRPGRDHEDRPAPADRHLRRSDPDDPGHRVIVRLGQLGEDRRGLGVLDARHQHVLARPAQRSRDLEDLLGGLLRTVDDFGDALPKCAMRIDTGIGRVDEGHMSEAIHRRLDVEAAAAHGLEERSEGVGVHRWKTSRSGPRWPAAPLKGFVPVQEPTE